MNFNKNMAEVNFIMMMEVFILEIGIKTRENFKENTIMETKMYLKVQQYILFNVLLCKTKIYFLFLN